MTEHQPNPRAVRPGGYTLEAWKRLGQFHTVQDRSLFVVDSSWSDLEAQSGCPVLLLLHGFPTSSWDWHYQWDALANRYRVITFDLLGFGYSDKPHNHRYRIHEQADLTLELLEQLGVGRFSILAHDYGDTVAQEILARSLEGGAPQIDAACLLNGGLFPETHRARLAQKLLVGPAGGLFVHAFGRRTLEKNLINVFGNHTAPTRTELDNFWALTQHNDGRRNLHRLMWYMKDRLEHRSRWVRALTDTNAPLGLINGSSDPVSGAHMVDRFRELVGKGDIVELPGIGHYPQLEAPEEVTHHVLTFFEDHIQT